MNLRRIKFSTYLGIISIVGFVAILINALTGFDIGVWADSILFLTIGFALMISGGIQFFLKYFNNGLTITEVNRIVTIVTGVASFIVGILTIPFFGITLPIIDGIRAIIASIAIATIAIDMVSKK